MPQPKRSFLDKLFGPKRREAVPRTFRDEFKEEMPTPAKAEEHLVGSSPSVNYTETHKTLEKISDEDHEQILNRALEQEKALVYGQMAQQRPTANEIMAQQAGLQQSQIMGRQMAMQQRQMNNMLDQAARMTGAANIMQGPDPDPRHFLPEWKRLYGDLGRGTFNGGGK